MVNWRRSLCQSFLWDAGCAFIVFIEVECHLFCTFEVLGFGLRVGGSIWVEGLGVLGI